MEQSIFSERLREIMSDTQTTQKALASAMGIKPQSISQYATGLSEPPLSRLKDIADYFKVSADWLIGISDDKSRHSSVIDDYGFNEAACKQLEECRSYLSVASNRTFMQHVNNIISNPEFPAVVCSIETVIQAYENAIYYECHPKEFDDLLMKLPPLMENDDGEIHHLYHMYSPEFGISAERFQLNESMKRLLDSVIQVEKLEERLKCAKEIHIESNRYSSLIDSLNDSPLETDTSQQGNA